MDAKLTCIAANYPAVATSANTLKAKCDEADEFVTNGDPANGEFIHEVLENVELTAIDWCDNGTSIGAPAMIEVLDDFKAELNELF